MGEAQVAQVSMKNLGALYVGSPWCIWFVLLCILFYIPSSIFNTNIKQNFQLFSEAQNDGASPLLQLVSCQQLATAISVWILTYWSMISGGFTDNSAIPHGGDQPRARARGRLCRQHLATSALANLPSFGNLDEYSIVQNRPKWFQEVGIVKWPLTA